MEAKLVVLCHNVEEEGVSVVVESLVIQKHLGNQTQVLGIGLDREDVRNVKHRYQIKDARINQSSTVKDSPCFFYRLFRRKIQCLFCRSHSLVDDTGCTLPETETFSGKPNKAMLRSSHWAILHPTPCPIPLSDTTILLFLRHAIQFRSE